MEGNEVSCTSDEEEEALDPRIQSELERLNKASEEINTLELSLQDARSKFRSILNESTSTLDALSKKLGSCVEKARPYYQARLNAKTLQTETQKSALRFERACSMHAAAKEMVNVAEQGFLNNNKGQRQQFDTAWQEMLNHATSKVNEAETEIMESELEHAKMTCIFHESEQTVKKLHHQHKRAINKSRPYFELKGELNRRMDEQKTKVDKLSKELKIQKYAYGYALKQLETISNEIHAERDKRRARKALGKRGSGVGAEDPDPSPDNMQAMESARKPEPIVETVPVSKTDEADSSPVKIAVSSDPGASQQQVSASASASPRRSPARDKKSLILSAGALNQEFRHLSLPKTIPGPSIAVEEPQLDRRASSPPQSSQSWLVKDVEKDRVCVSPDSESVNTLDSEDVLDTDSEASSIAGPDDDMVADAMNDFTDELEEPLERFRTLPANVKYADLKGYFKQGDLKKWHGEVSLK